MSRQTALVHTSTPCTQIQAWEHVNYLAGQSLEDGKLTKLLSWWIDHAIRGGCTSA